MEILAILNITDDSFYQKDNDPEAVLKKIGQFIDAEVDYIDVGVESSNPQGKDVSPEEQVKRLDEFFNIFERCCSKYQVGRKQPVKLPKLSLDSYRPQVLEFGLKRGAKLINDISGLRDLKILDLAFQFNVPVISMYNHQRENPRALFKAQTLRDVNHQDGIKIVESAAIENIVPTVIAGLKELQKKVERFKKIGTRQLILDPGMGFFLGTEPSLSYRVLGQLADIQALGNKVCVSVSHKSFLNAKLSAPERGHETSLAEFELIRLGVDYIRTHDPIALRRTIQFFQNLNIVL